jgi:glutaredoxin 3
MAAALAEYVAKNAIVIFGMKGCPYCVKAVGLAKANWPNDYTYIDVADPAYPQARSAFAEIERQYSHDTYPAVFVGSKFIGGCDDTHALHAQGKLANAVAEAKAQRASKQ